MNSKERRISNRHRRHHDKQELQKAISTDDPFEEYRPKTPTYSVGGYVAHRSPQKVGDKIVLPTICGKYEFTVVSMTEKSVLLESGLIQARLQKVGSVWRYNHCTWSKDTVVKVQIV